MSELGDKIVQERFINPAFGGPTDQEWKDLRSELIALRKYHTLAEGFGPVQAANKRTETWKTQALEASARLQKLTEAVREKIESMRNQDSWGVSYYADELEEILREHTG